MQCRFKDQHGNFPRFSNQIDHPASINVRSSLLLDLLEQLLRLLDQACIALNLGVGSRIVSSFQSQLYLLDTGLELNKALLHSAAEVEQDDATLELLLHCLPLAAGQACEHVDVVVDAPELAQTIDHFRWSLKAERWLLSGSELVPQHRSLWSEGSEAC